jgi:hypothetical protein
LYLIEGNSEAERLRVERQYCHLIARHDVMDGNFNGLRTNEDYRIQSRLEAMGSK